jgi:hypothetical protein
MPHYTRSIPRLVLLSIWIVPLGVVHGAGQTSQTPGFSRPLEPNAAIVKLLQSNDPREQAWGAWYAGRDHLTQFVPLLQQLVTQHVSGLSLSEIAAVDVALDALIQMRQGLPSSALRSVFERRPEQALILAGFATRDDGEVDELLFEVLRANDYDRWFAAANVLLQRRTFGLASAIINNLRLTVHVHVTSDNSLTGGSGSGSGGAMGVGCGGRGAAPGLPPWANYRLGTSAQPGLVVMSTGPIPVYYQRIVAPAGSTPSANSVHRAGPTADDRLRYLAWLAGRSNGDLPVRGIDTREIRLDVSASLDPALEGVRADILSRWSLLAQALVRTSALSKESAAAELPALDFVVHDWRQSGASPLAKR